MITPSPDSNVTSSTRAFEPDCSVCGSGGSAVTRPMSPKYGSRIARTGAPISRRPITASDTAAGARVRSKRNDNLRAHHAGANLRRAVHGRVIAGARRQQIEGPARHRDLAEPFGDDDGQSDALGAGNGHAQVVAEHRLEVGIVDAAGDDRRHADRAGTLDGLCRDARAAHDHAVFQIGRDEIFRQFLIVPLGDHADGAERLAADAEDALDERHVRFNHAALVGKHFDHLAGQVRLHLNR